MGPIGLVAIGGIDEQNVKQVLNAGANSAAIIGALVGKPDSIVERTRLLMDLAASIV
jgi:thiamine monophosphate synthase